MGKFVGKRLVLVLLMGLISGLLLVGMVSAQDAETTPEPDAVGIIDAATDAANGISGAAGNIWTQITRTPTSDVARILMIVGGVGFVISLVLTFNGRSEPPPPPPPTTY